MYLGKKQAFKWNIVFQYVLIVIIILKGIVLIPVYLVHIDNDLYGYWLAIGGIANWVMIVDPGFGNLIQQKISKSFGEGNLETVGNYISTANLIGVCIFGIALIFGVSFIVLIPFFVKKVLLINYNVLIYVFVLAVIGTSFYLFSSIIKSIGVGLQRTKEYGIAETAISVFTLCINIILLFLGYGLYSIGVMILLNGLLLFVSYFVINRKYVTEFSLNVKQDWKLTKGLKSEIGYTFISRIVNAISTNVDLLIISKFIGPEMVTVVEISKRPFKILESFVYKPSVALAPVLSNIVGSSQKDKVKHTIGEYIKITSIVYILLVLNFYILGDDLTKLWVGDEYVISGMLALLLYVGIAMKGNFAALGNLYFALGKVKETSILISIQNICYLSLLILLGTKWDLLGILVALPLSVSLTTMWYFLTKMLHEGWLEKSDLLESFIKSFTITALSYIALSLMARNIASSWGMLIVIAVMTVILEALLGILFLEKLRNYLKIKFKR